MRKASALKKEKGKGSELSRTGRRIKKSEKKAKKIREIVIFSGEI